MKKNELILYRNLPNQEIFDEICAVMEGTEDTVSAYYEALSHLTEIAEIYGLSGNLWHAYLAYALASHENVFSCACEIRTGSLQDTRSAMARHDFAILYEAVSFDFTTLVAKGVPEEAIAYLTDYENEDGDSKFLNHRIRDRIMELAKGLGELQSADDLYEQVVSFYRDFGVGKLGLHKAFKIVHEDGHDMEIAPITCTEHVHFADLQGYELQKQKLIANTEAFLAGKPANNVLLFGDAGTGKSSSVKALLNEYYANGLRMIELYKHQFRDLPAIIAEIQNRNYKFIIFMDDLSFEEFEIEYKYLKAVIEGGLEKKPDNVLIYATSNRRHLIRENFSDRDERDEDLHSFDTVQEKLSLAYRFGVTIYYGKPNPKEFRAILDKIAEDEQIDMPKDQLYQEANAWELSHGGLSGRTARQFIMHLKGQIDD